MRSVLIAGIRQMKAEAEAHMDSWQYFALDERTKKIQSDLHKLEAKNMAIECMEKTTEFQADEFRNENSEVYRLCLDLKAQLRAKMASFCKESAEPTSDRQPACENENDAIEGQGKLHARKMAEAATPVTTPMVQTFGGIADWNRFEKEIQQKITENDNLQSEQKFAALINACVGTEAEFVVTQLGENSYDKAVEKLKSAFGNKYKQTMHYINELARIPRLENPSAMDLSSMTNGIEHCYTKLIELLGKGVEQWIPFYAISKMDNDTRVAWERQTKALALSWAQTEQGWAASEYLPSWQAVKAFLEDEAQLHLQFLEKVVHANATRQVSTGISRAYHEVSACNSANNMQRRTGNTSGAHRSKPNPHCECDYWHPLHKCDVFKAMDLDHRADYCFQNEICVRCLLAAHSQACADPVANQWCTRCAPEQVKHNSMLCPVSYRRYNAA